MTKVKIYNNYFSSFIKYSICAVLIFLMFSCKSKDKDSYGAVEKYDVETTFIGSASCKSCHEEEFASWKGSHHDQAMKIADSITILGDFDNSTFTHKNVKSTFFKKGKEYFVNTEGSDGNYYEYKIEYTFGFTPLQQYIVKFPNGEYQCLITAWDAIKNTWFHLQPNLDIKHDEWMHWTGGAMNWNTMCADCHSTDLRKNFSSTTQSYTTTYSEINVSCEACHGPSSTHVDYYEENPNGKNPPEMYMPNFLNSKELVDKCARCHSRRSQITKVFDYSGDFFDHYIPSLLIDPTYELDGQIKDEDYVYASFVQSKMYHNGISCRDCHDVHSLQLIKTGNNLCLTCHVPKYNTYEHHFHKENTEASLCINCHMTGKYYMGNDFRRDHSFRVPRPDQSEKYGTPNACNGCHDEKNEKWAADFIAKSYGPDRIDHFSDHLLKGYFENKSSFEYLFSNLKYPEIARATAMNQYTSQSLTETEVNNLLHYLKDSSALVRRETILGFEKLGLSDYATNIKPLLKDSINIVRLSAVRYFNAIGQQNTTEADFQNANKDFLIELEMNSDFASGQHQIAIYEQSKGNIESSIIAYERALEIDSYFNMSRMNLALLYYQQGRPSESEQLYLKVIDQEPEFSFSYYMLGLLYNELGNNEKSLEYLAFACEKEPVNFNAYYNYALKLQEVGMNKKFLNTLEKGLKLFPDNERLLYLMLLNQINENLTVKALETCKRLLAIAPGNENYQQIFNQLLQ